MTCHRARAARGYWPLLFTLVGLVASGPAVGAASLVLRPVADATLFESVTTNNLGASTTLMVGSTDKGERNRGLLKFDLAAALPAGAVVRSARLDLVLTADASGGTGTLGIRLHRVLAPWGEGVGLGNRGSAALAGEVTWTHRHIPTDAWSAPGAEAGADYHAAVTAAATVGGTGTWSWSEGLAADLQFWMANPGLNHGWILVSDSDATVRTSRRFATREDAARAPQLTIEYETGSVPAQLSGPTLQQGQFRLLLPLAAQRDHALEFRDAFGPGTWQELTNFVAQPTEREVEYLVPLTGSSRFFRLRTGP